MREGGLGRCLTWTPPEADLESRTLGQVDYLGGDPRKHWKEDGEVRAESAGSEYRVW